MKRIISQIIQASITVCLAALLIPRPNAAAPQSGAAMRNDSASTATRVGEPFTLPTCPVFGEKLGARGKPVLFMHEGREVRVCCANCVLDFVDMPKMYLQRVDEQTIRYQLPFYPLESCVVSGDPLAAQGEPVDFVYFNRLVRVCAADCMEAFKAEPEQYLRQLDAAVIERQGPLYPLAECVVSGDKLEGAEAPYDFVVANQLVRLCREICLKDFKRTPALFLSRLEKARAAKLSQAAGGSEPASNTAAAGPNGR